MSQGHHQDTIPDTIPDNIIQVEKMNQRNQVEVFDHRPNDPGQFLG